MDTNGGRQTDELLQPFLQAKDEDEARLRLETLLTEHAEPVMRRIISRKLRTQTNRDGRSYSRPEADDLHAEVLVELLKQLQQRRADPVLPAVGDLRKYAATLTAHACAEFFRRCRPQRYRLLNKLRRLLTTQPGLALWRDAADEWVGGFAVWRARPVERTRRYLMLRDDPQAASRAALPAADVVRMNPATLAAALFDWVGGPVELDDLMSAFAAFWGVTDHVEQLDDHTAERGPRDIADPTADVAHQVAQRLHLQRVWEEICALPVPQRMALLLNLRDDKGACVTALLPIAGIASIRRIAEVLELPPAEFYRLWGDLPLDDATIAAMLGLTRQQVINLRMTARKRLARRVTGG